MNYVRLPIEIESPEHIGYNNIQNNLAESSVTDTILSEDIIQLKGLKLAYIDHYGHPALRELIAQDIGNGINANDILLTMGATGALYMVHQALLKAGDEVVVIQPNYSTNYATPIAMGCKVSYWDLNYNNGWVPKMSELEKVLTPNTKLVSVTTPNNPTGVCVPERVMDALAELAETNDFYVLIDETYRDLNFNPKAPYAATRSKRFISVCSLSKAFGLPGLRIGWTVCQDPKLNETLLAVKEQMHICNSAVDEELAFAFFAQRNMILQNVKQHVQKNKEFLLNWFKTQTQLEVIPPEGGVVCFPRIKESNHTNLDTFYHNLLHKHGTLVGPGHWFNMPKNYMRIGFGYPSFNELKAGLHAIEMELTHLGG